MTCHLCTHAGGRASHAGLPLRCRQPAPTHGLPHVPARMLRHGAVARLPCRPAERRCCHRQQWPGQRQACRCSAW